MDRIRFDTHAFAVAEFFPFGTTALPLRTRQTALAGAIAGPAMLRIILEVGARIAATRRGWIRALARPGLTRLTAGTSVVARTAVQWVLRGIDTATCALGRT